MIPTSCQIQKFRSIIRIQDPITESGRQEEGGYVEDMETDLLASTCEQSARFGPAFLEV